MSQELFYTSAPRGLKSGSRDYCTVSRTQSVSPAMADLLETLSGYRILFMPHDPRAPRNPVAWSHVQMPIGPRLVSVLSRICASGLDYTGRTNKFAHHLALDDHERPPGGPAWLMSQNGFMVSAWDGHVGVIPTGRTPPSGDFAPRPAVAWSAVAGDAGWAGVLAETFLADPRRLVYLTYTPGLDLLPLFAEAQALLPADRRWEVGFNTYYTNLPPGITCQWRGIIADSPEIEETQKISNSLVLDLTQPLGEARGGDLVAQARTGARSATRVTPPPPPKVTPPPLLPSPSRPRAERQDRPGPDHSPAYDVAPAAPPPLRRPVPPLQGPRRREAEERKESLVPLIAGSAVVGLILFLGVLILMNRNPSSTMPTPTSGDGTSVTSSDHSEGGTGGGRTPGNVPEAAPERSGEFVGPPEVAGNGKTGTATKPPAEGSDAPGAVARAAPAPEANEILFQKLPPIVKAKPSEEVVLSPRPLDGDDWTFEIKGLEDKDLQSFQLKAKAGSENEGKVTRILFGSDDLDLNLNGSTEVATFSLKENRLAFRWLAVVKETPLQEQPRPCGTASSSSGKGARIGGRSSSATGRRVTRIRSRSVRHTP